MQSAPTDDSMQVELFISARGLEDKDWIGKSDPLVKVYELINNEYVQIGQTEQIKDNLNPDFKTTITMKFVFETKQPLKFAVFDEDGKNSEQSLGECCTELGKLVGAPKQCSTLELTDQGKNAGKLIVRVDSTQTQTNSDQIVVWQWAGQKIKNMDGLFGHSDPFLRFLRSTPEGEFLAYETPQVMDNANPVWKPFDIPYAKLCYGKSSEKFTIECWDWQKSGKHQFIGKVQTSIDELSKTQNLDIVDGKGKKAGTLILKSMVIRSKPNFIEYLRGGESLSFILAVDFTGSNGIPTQPFSLHYLNPDGKLNQYQAAIQAVGEIILSYDADRRIPAFGFGGIPHFKTLKSSSVNHCFPLNGDPKSPEVSELKGIMEAYKNALENVDLSGPTYFEGVLQQAIKVAEANSKTNVYSCLLIVTDGEIHDQQKTIDLIVAASGLPLSVIIVGVGEEEFKNMRCLDGDVVALKSSNGTFSNRDIVQFVKFTDYQDHASLAKDVLAELPKQLVAYKLSQGLWPNPPLM